MSFVWFQFPTWEARERQIGHPHVPDLSSLTRNELQSLMWIAAIANRAGLPHAHIEKLLAAGYIHEELHGASAD